MIGWCFVKEDAFVVQGCKLDGERVHSRCPVPGNNYVYRGRVATVPELCSVGSQNNCFGLEPFSGILCKVMVHDMQGHLVSMQPSTGLRFLQAIVVIDSCIS